MPATTPSTGSGGFSAEERAAMKARAAELRAEGKKGARQADDLQALLGAIAKMAPQDRALAERLHATITANAPDLAPRTWYGMPAYADADGKIVVSFKNSGKFNTRYSTLEFQDAAHLDQGEIWPVSYALQTWSPAVEKKVVELVRAARAQRSAPGRRSDSSVHRADAQNCQPPPHGFGDPDGIRSLGFGRRYGSVEPRRHLAVSGA